MVIGSYLSGLHVLLQLRHPCFHGFVTLKELLNEIKSLLSYLIKISLKDVLEGGGMVLGHFRELGNSVHHLGLSLLRLFKSSLGGTDSLFDWAVGGSFGSGGDMLGKITL